jgi:hypothetical protein
MGNGGVLEVIGEIEWGVVEFEDGHDPENRNECRDHDTGQSKVGEHGGLACLIISLCSRYIKRRHTSQGDLVTLMYTASNHPFAKKTVTAALKHKRG